MTRNKSMSMKAMFLLVVFLLNTMTGFACAVGMDMGFNEGHHHKHADGHQHQHADLDHHQKSGGEKENCCKDAVAKLTASDKLTQRIFDFSQLSLPFIVLPGIIYPQNLVVCLPVNVPNAHFSRHCRSPIRDVRIAIQSFQI